jgi:HEAT repeat protein
MVELISAVAAGGAVGVTAVFAAVRRARARVRSWRSAARRIGLGEVVETPRRWLRRPTLVGRAEQLRVRLESYRRGKYESGTRIVIDGFGPGVEALSLGRGGLGLRLLGREDVLVGDADFDQELHVQGPALLTLALLPAATRLRARRLLSGEVPGPHEQPIMVSAQLDKGVLEVRFRERLLATSNEDLFHVLKSALALAKRLVVPNDLAAQIADNLRDEPEAGVRLNSLLTLVRELPDHPATRGALLAALKDRSDEVRLRAAMALGDEGHATLRALLAGFITDDACAAAALRALGDRLPSGKVKNVLERVLKTDRKRTAKACLETLGGRGHAGARDLYIQALRYPDTAVMIAAVQALGRVGTAADVAVLRQEAETWLPTQQRSAARQAIAEIQSRLSGAGPGQLTLAAGEAGALSLAEQAGGLSLAPEAEGEPEDWPGTAEKLPEA